MKWYVFAMAFFLQLAGTDGLAAGADCSGCHAAIERGEARHAPLVDGCGDCHLPTVKEHRGQKSDFILAAKGALLCLTCHDDPRQGQKIPHPPAAEGDCTACHDPHGGSANGLLKAEGSELCLGCHTDPAAGKSFVHTPVKEGHCTDCHDPHKGELPGLLRASGAALCSECHVWRSTAYRQHGPVAGGNCRLCHEVHAGVAPGNLRLAGAGVCFPCHGGIERQIKLSKYQHAPVAAGNCQGCHVPHGNGERPYLVARYPKDFYVPFNEADFALCFRCHSKNLVVYQRTSAATGFRNGDRNMHYLHVNRSDKGRVCKVCHGVHGADQPRLLKSRSAGFGNWDIPIQMTFTETGGTCYVGCHNPKSYDRVRPVKNR